MSIELYAGKGTIHNVALNTETLNDLLDQLNLPFEITEGFIGLVTDYHSLVNNQPEECVIVTWHLLANQITVFCVSNPVTFECMKLLIT